MIYPVSFLTLVLSFFTFFFRLPVLLEICQFNLFKESEHFFFLLLFSFKQFFPVVIFLVVIYAPLGLFCSFSSLLRKWAENIDFKPLFFNVTIECYKFPSLPFFKFISPILIYHNFILIQIIIWFLWLSLLCLIRILVVTLVPPK